MHIEFWSEIIEDSPDIFKLQNLGTQINESLNKITNCF